MDKSYILNDPIGQLIKKTPGFRGKGRLIQYWLNHRTTNSQRIRVLPGGGKVLCDFSVPYEAMVWLEHEEQQDLELVRQLLKPGQLFVDCGANIGIWTLVAASLVGAEGKIYAFEPNPLTFKKLNRNISLNEFGHNIQVFASAVGKDEGNLSLTVNQYHNLSQITYSSDREAITVPVMKLDALLNEQKVNGIKVDVEGFELEVLQGAESILKQHQPWLCVEFNTVLSGVNQLSDWNVHQYLTALGYVCRQFRDSLDTTRQTILPDYWQTTGYCNLYYAVK